MRDASLPYFLGKMNYALSPLLKREERGIKKTKNIYIYMMRHICFFFLVNWSYFTIGLLY
jgi:hypothetical protein